MHRLQELVRLHRLGCSARVIARQLHMSTRSSATSKHWRAADCSRAIPAKLPELGACIDAQAPPKAAPQQVSSIELWLSRIEELHRRAGPTAIHDFLRVNEPDYTGSLSAVKRVCRRLDRARGPTPEEVAIPVETAPGQVARVDFKHAGKRYDPAQGLVRKSWIFLTTPGFSRRSFAQLVFDQKVETWLSLHVEAFEYFGGVPRVVVPDNLKAAVVRCAFGIDYDPVLNRSVRELARYCGFQVDPAPPSEPKKKGKVESGCRYVGTSFLSAWPSVDMRACLLSLRGSHPKAIRASRFQCTRCS